ncbi:hypothetical protein FB45DRAFT_873604 [Roridomyces roridus]|uniref:Uncharacterized protein n=1 Tax=Roridomyces roridus TaxID=1738132 RepID=A0AAD7BB23_9AGAR|nr:hypothetical protein FB45DRAFT_873604 [Roridomyces roridus]
MSLCTCPEATEPPRQRTRLRVTRPKSSPCGISELRRKMNSDADYLMEPIRIERTCGQIQKNLDWEVPLSEKLWPHTASASACASFSLTLLIVVKFWDRARERWRYRLERVKGGNRGTEMEAGLRAKQGSRIEREHLHLSAVQHSGRDEVLGLVRFQSDEGIKKDASDR